jgi:hypothetical protein
MTVQSEHLASLSIGHGLNLCGFEHLRRDAELREMIDVFRA